MSRPLFLQFGAGNIGRSLVGAVFSRAGYEVLFVDAADDLVRALHARRSYRVVIKDDLPPDEPGVLTVGPVDAIAAADRAAVTDAVARADLIGTAVGAQAFQAVLASLAEGVARRTRPVSILFCENLHDAAARARRELVRLLPAGFSLSGRVGLVATSIGKMVPLMPAEVRAHDPLEVWGEAYNRIVADRDGFAGGAPRIEGLELHGCFQAYVDRKLYVHNLGHAVCACHGFLRGCRLIAEAVAAPAVLRETREAMSAAAMALVQRYPSEFDGGSQREHVADLLRRFGNRALGDTVYRVGRDLPRKLGPDDRFVGALRLVTSAGGNADAICRGVAAALRFRATDDDGRAFPADAAFLSRVEKAGPRRVLIDHSGLDAGRDRALLDRIEADYASLAAFAPSADRLCSAGACGSLQGGAGASA
jgi:mannitol-1-phosphate 5-dehydrogenase